ncbi:MerR family transcriptional regulator [Corynebacterium lehmanniae]|uniref:MerR family transcriptional regulator n=1 Tax=Corynebacterium lehmanniae TaxID=2913497 RepID=A0ABT4R7W1_9CORY|nr:MerR family transcriptional regulator [Corynebacterium lehmanniae]MCZ9291648.1 MerR family transcriptional regulator [Corynebacterium lehmanniae]
MADGIEYTIGEAAEALGVSTKALRHWEAIGLIAPARTWADHRVYSEADLERGAAIALYRGVGVPLAQIAKLLDASGATLTRALKHHQEALASRRRTLDAQLASVQHLIDNATKGSIDMDAMKKYLGEDMPAYQEEAEQRWGDTPEWAQSQEKLAQMGEGDFKRLKDEQDAFAADLVKARDAGVEPGSEEAAALVERHRASIAQWYDVTPARQLILARMYVGDPRFHEAYNGAQDYLLELVTAHAAAEGVDVDNPQWG